MRLQFVRAWGRYVVGNIIEPPASLRQRLLAAGFCRLAPPTTTEPPSPKPRPRARARQAEASPSADLYPPHPILAEGSK